MSKQIHVKLDNNSEKSINIEKDIIPMNKQLLVKTIKVIKQKEKANLILSTVHLGDTKYCIGIVIRVAADVSNINENDIVIYKKGWAPIDFEVDGIKFSFVKSEDISGKYSFSCSSKVKE